MASLSLLLAVCCFLALSHASLLPTSALQSKKLMSSRLSLLHRLVEATCHGGAGKTLAMMRAESLGADIEAQLYGKLQRMLVDCQLDKALHLPHPVECVYAKNFTDSWRQDVNGTNIRGAGPHSDGGYACDLRDGVEWFRFTGAAGKRMRDHCPARDYSCGTIYPIWTDGPEPTEVGVSKSMVAYGLAKDNCKSSTIPLLVMRCSSAPHDFIYRTAFNYGSHICAAAFCGMS